MKAPTTALTFALATLFGLAVAYAQQQPQASPQQRFGQQPGQQTTQQPGQAVGQEKELPEMLKSLNLKEEQKQQIKQICSKHDQELTQLQQQFLKLHNKAVMLEAAWATALESQMDDTQKQKFRQSREKAHQDQKRESGRSEVYFRGEPAEETGGTQQQGSQPEARQQGEQPRSGQPIQQRNLQNNQQRDQVQRGAQPGVQDRLRQQQGSQQTARTGQESGRILIIAITSPRQYYTAAGLSDEQERKCEQMCEAFHEELGSVWRQLRTVHQEMVAIEAEKMAEVEKVLTEEQLQQLKRQHEQFQTSTQAPGEDSDQIRLQPRDQNRTFKDKDNSTNNNNDN